MIALPTVSSADVYYIAAILIECIKHRRKIIKVIPEVKSEGKVSLVI